MDQRDILLTMIAEAFGEGDEGMRRVGETILNRAAIRGIDPVDVVRQPHQYTGYSAPGPAAVAAQQDPAVMSAAQAAWELARQPGDPTNGADHYHADYVNPGWASAMPSTGKYGQHLFYKSTDVPPDALAALLSPQAPIPHMPPARGNVPSSLIADSFSTLPQHQASTGLSPSTVKSVVDMFAEPVRNVTSYLTKDGQGVTDPAGVVFGPQMEKNIWPQRTDARLPEVAPPNTQSKTSASDRARGNSGISTIASIPTTGIGQPPVTREVQPVAMPAQAATHQNIPQSYAGQDGSLPLSSWSDFATMFGKPATEYNPNAHPFAGGGEPKPIPGPNAPPKTAERLAPSGINLVNTKPGNNNPYGAEFDPFDETFVPMPTKRPETRTITEQVPNPDWTADLAAKGVPAGMKVNFGSRDTVAQRAAGIAAAKNIPQFITRTRQVPVATPAARAPLRVTVNGANPTAARGKSVVQAIRDSTGASAQQAYDMANRQSVEKAIANAGDSGAARRLNERLGNI